MYISIRQYKTDRIKEVTKKVDESFSPYIKKTDGFIAYYVVESNDDTWTSVSIFDSKEQAQASNLAAKSWVKENAIDTLLYSPKITAGDIVSTTTNKSVLDASSIIIFLLGAVTAIVIAQLFKK